MIKKVWQPNLSKKLSPDPYFQQLFIIFQQLCRFAGKNSNKCKKEPYFYKKQAERTFYLHGFFNHFKNFTKTLFQDVP